jgi:O-antigen/teichoic acid export membrane protein
MLAVRSVMIHALYSNRFELASGMLGYIIAGDIAKAVSWAFAGPLLYRGQFRAFLVTEVVGGAMAVVANLTMVHLMGPIGAGAAYPITYAGYMVLTGVVLARSCGVPVNTKALGSGLVITGVAVGLEALGDRGAPVRWAAAGIALGYLWRTGASSYLASRFRGAWGRLFRVQASSQGP